MKLIFSLLASVLIFVCYEKTSAAYHGVPVAPIVSGAISKKFEIYHDINWVNTPKILPFKHLPAFNLAPESGVYWSGDRYLDDPDEAATKSYVMTFPYGEQRYLNVEHLPYQYARSTVEEQLNTIRKLSMIIHWAKIQRPDIEIGMFAITVEKLFGPLSKSPIEYIGRNKRFKSLAEYADVIYLDMYTWWSDRHNKWSEALVSSTTQARLTGKKVIAFIWPHYQSPASCNVFMPGTEWRLQLEEAYKLTDGIVIWDKKTCDWNTCASETDPNNWYYQTLEFMKSKDL